MWVAVGELLLKRLTTPLSTINKKIRLEAYTEQCESNPGLSLGIMRLKIQTSVWKTVPTKHYHLQNGPKQYENQAKNQLFSVMNHYGLVRFKNNPYLWTGIKKRTIDKNLNIKSP